MCSRFTRIVLKVTSKFKLAKKFRSKLSFEEIYILLKYVRVSNSLKEHLTLFSAEYVEGGLLNIWYKQSVFISCWAPQKPGLVCLSLNNFYLIPSALRKYYILYIIQFCILQEGHFVLKPACVESYLSVNLLKMYDFYLQDRIIVRQVNAILFAIQRLIDSQRRYLPPRQAASIFVRHTVPAFAWWERFGEDWELYYRYIYIEQVDPLLTWSWDAFCAPARLPLRSPEEVAYLRKLFKPIEEGLVSCVRVRRRVSFVERYGRVTSAFFLSWLSQEILNKRVRHYYRDKYSRCAMHAQVALTQLFVQNAVWVIERDGVEEVVDVETRRRYYNDFFCINTEPFHRRKLRQAAVWTKFCLFYYRNSPSGTWLDK